jgi:hypothetical protein
MTDQMNEGRRRLIQEEGRKALEELDRVEQQFFEAIRETREILDREEAEARERFAETREATLKHLSSLMDE